MINELNGSGAFVCDALTSDGLSDWTADRCPDGMYSARYDGGVRNAETGEWTGGAWVDDAAPSPVVMAIEAKRAEINAWRNEQENAGFDWGGHTFDSDELSRQRLMAVALAGVAPANGYWTSADNVDVPVTVDDVRAMYATMIQIGAEIHDRQRSMKIEIEQMTDADQISNYVVGWGE